MDPINQKTNTNTPSQQDLPIRAPIKNGRMNILVISLSIFVFILILLVGYLFYQNNQLQKQIDVLKTTNVTTLPEVSPTPSASISAEKAAEIVSNLSEVKTFVSQTKNAKISLNETDSTDKFWSIHVYESFTDHDSTFHWYQVDKTTGEVTTQI